MRTRAQLGAARMTLGSMDPARGAASYNVKCDRAEMTCVDRRCVESCMRHSEAGQREHL